MAKTVGVTKLQLGRSDQKCAQLPSFETCDWEPGVKVVALVPLDSFLAHEVKWTTEPEPGLDRGFSFFHPLRSSASSLSSARALFSVSVSFSCIPLEHLLLYPG